MRSARNDGTAASGKIERRLLLEEDIFARELELLWSRSWVVVGHSSELKEAGDYIASTVGGQPIMVLRNEAGDLNAFYNTCSHRGAILAPGKSGNCGQNIQCIYHAWVYGLDGQLKHVPAEKGYDKFNTADHGLKKLRLDSCAGLIFVCLNDDVEPLDVHLGNMADYIRQSMADSEVVGRVSWTLDANWKLWRENMADGYHALYTHQALGYMMTAYNAQMETLPGGHSRLTHHNSADSFSPQRFIRIIEKSTGLPAVENELEAAFPAPPKQIDFPVANHIIGLFPNATIMDNFGSTELSVQFAVPLSVDKTLIHCLVVGQTDDTPEMKEFRRRNSLAWMTPSGKAEGDDLEAWARCQQGAAARSIPLSDISRGMEAGDMSSGDQEVAMRAFYVAYEEKMAEAL